MSRLFALPLAATLLLLAACAAKPGYDYGLDGKPLTSLRASVWVDPNGCEHWVIDDMAEGYMTVRRGRDGKPICRGSGGGAAAGAASVSMEATIWTDERGCQHWVVDDGAEGFMTERLMRDGRPVCKGAGIGKPVETVTLAADALFASGSARLRPAARAGLDEFGTRMQRLGKRRAFIVGHTDSRASDRYNQRLSERRAAAVAAYLSRRFDIAGRTEGRGEREPVADNATAAGRQANRRVVISVLD